MKAEDDLTSVSSSEVKINENLSEHSNTIKKSSGCIQIRTDTEKKEMADAPDKDCGKEGS